MIELAGPTELSYTARHRVFDPSDSPVTVERMLSCTAFGETTDFLLNGTLAAWIAVAGDATVAWVSEPVDGADIEITVTGKLELRSATGITTVSANEFTGEILHGRVAAETVNLEAHGTCHTVVGAGGGTVHAHGENSSIAATGHGSYSVGDNGYVSVHVPESAERVQVKAGNDSVVNGTVGSLVIGANATVAISGGGTVFAQEDGAFELVGEYAFKVGAGCVVSARSTEDSEPKMMRSESAGSWRFDVVNEEFVEIASQVWYL